MCHDGVAPQPRPQGAGPGGDPQARVVRPRQPRAPEYDAKTVAALRRCWAVLGAPAGKRLAPVMHEMVPTLRRFGELRWAPAGGAGRW